MKRRSIQGLRTVTFESGQRVALILLHGYGANAHDLVPLMKLMPSDDPYDWYFPEGPCSLGKVERAWFPIRVGELEFLEARERVPEGFSEATVQLKALVEEVKGHYDRVYLGGFSQGAMLATNLTLQWPELISKLFILSGILISEKSWKKGVEKIRDIPTFQSHGAEDGVLPFAGAKALDQLFRKKPDHEFHEFSGGHEIPISVLSALSRFLHA